MRGLNYDITRRSDAARRSSRRAEIRLAQKFHEAGGIEDEMRYNLSELKREQALLTRELAGLKFQSAKSLAQASIGQGIIHIHALKLHDDSSISAKEVSEEEHGPGTPVHKKDYGRNFFGYTSTPGSNNKHHYRSAKEIEKSLDKYYQKANDEMHDEKKHKKLKQQKKQNKNIQEKVDSWKKNNTPRRKFSFHEPAHVKHLAFLRKELLPQETEQEPEQATDSQLPKGSENLSGKQQQKESLEKASSPAPKQVKNVRKTNEQQRENVEKADSAKSSNKENKQLVSTTAQKDNSIFDTDLYAPDGRMRMAHRMPEFHKAFNEARQARYVRSKDKRDFEIQLNTSQVFQN